MLSCFYLSYADLASLNTCQDWHDWYMDGTNDLYCSSKDNDGNCQPATTNIDFYKTKLNNIADNYSSNGCRERYNGMEDAAGNPIVLSYLFKVQ